MGWLLGGVGTSGAIRGTSEGVGCQECIGGIRGVLGAGRECRYSGARRSIGGIKGHWGLLGV